LHNQHFTVEELMATAMAREIRDQEVVAVGTLSPVPAAGSLLAKMRHAPGAELIIWMLREYWPFTEGAKEFFDLAQKGKFDLFFLGGAQVDKKGNTNLQVIGDYGKPAVRLPGGAGTGTLYYTIPRVILFKTDHTKQSLVEKVDFVTGAAESPGNVFRRGGPTKCITPLAVFHFSRDEGQLVLESIHPGVTVEEVVKKTGFDLNVPEYIPSTPEPEQEELQILRTVIKEKLKNLYPKFVQAAFGG
jgi:glutaconate CoA-transferase subunit B